ncbi:MAG TPA: hypothetical protein V6D20_16395 [Candidatus Obscuribacterales bacterium]
MIDSNLLIKVALRRAIALKGSAKQRCDRVAWFQRIVFVMPLVDGASDLAVGIEL